MKAYLYRVIISFRRNKVFYIPIVVMFLVYYWFVSFGLQPQIPDEGKQIVYVQMNNGIGEVITHIIALVSAAFLAASVWMGARLHEASLISKHYDMYAQPEMARAMRRLMGFLREYKDDFRIHRTPVHNQPHCINASQNRSLKWPQDVDDARRKIKFYYFDAVDLYTSGKISRSSFKKLIDQSAICVLFDVIEPMEYMLNPVYDARRYYRLMLLFPSVYSNHKVYDIAINSNRIILPEEAGVKDLWKKVCRFFKIRKHANLH